MSAPHNLVDGAVHSLGSAAVLRPFFERLDAGRPVTLLALGSSITTNRGGFKWKLVRLSVGLALE